MPMRITDNATHYIVIFEEDNCQVIEVSIKKPFPLRDLERKAESIMSMLPINPLQEKIQMEAAQEGVAPQAVETVLKEQK